MTEQITGTVAHIVYRNEENGYTVFEITGEECEETCIGYFAGISEGMVINAQGIYMEHASYGRQFKVEQYEFREPETTEAIELYLGSGAVKGIGKALAKRIVKRFGDDAMRIFEEEPERLAEIKGISLAKARTLGEEAARQADMRKAMIFLENLGISLKMSIRIYKKYGDDVYGIIRENPYRLSDDIDGIGFLTADRLAQKAGIAPDSPFRIKSGVLFVLTNAAGDGHVCLPESQLMARAADLLSVEEALVEDAVTDLTLARQIVIKEAPRGKYGEVPEGTRFVYIASYYYMELGAARKLIDLAMPLGADPDETERKVDGIMEESGILLEDAQRDAVLAAVENGVLILTGGPGTGKTTTINALIRYFRNEGLDVALAAPTGRASKRMTEATGYEASTIHRLLEVSASQDDEEVISRFGRGRDRPLEADVVVIDEMSMVDIFLFHALLDAIVPGTRLILVGDDNQLPSVGPGSVLRDILASEAFPAVTLTRIFRQAASSDIVVNAHRIHAGEEIKLTNDSKDFFFLRRDDPDRILRNTLELIKDRLPGYVGAKPYDIQVLAPMKKGTLGVDRINTILQRYLNPPGRGKREKEYGDRVFRTGDKVMQMRNNYQITWETRGRHGIKGDEGTGIFNGDLGTIRDIKDYENCMEIEFDEGRYVDYPYASLEDLELAYAATIHKSQGSEYPAVILPILGGPRMLMTRNLLYTAVTRAKSCVVVIGSEEAVRDMIRNDIERLRFTTLDERIREICGSGTLEL